MQIIRRRTLNAIWRTKRRKRAVAETCLHCRRKRNLLSQRSRRSKSRGGAALHKWPFPQSRWYGAVVGTTSPDPVRLCASLIAAFRGPLVRSCRINGFGSMDVVGKEGPFSPTFRGLNGGEVFIFVMPDDVGWTQALSGTASESRVTLLIEIESERSAGTSQVNRIVLRSKRQPGIAFGFVTSELLEQIFEGLHHRFEVVL